MKTALILCISTHFPRGRPSVVNVITASTPASRHWSTSLAAYATLSTPFLSPGKTVPLVACKLPRGARRLGDSVMKRPPFMFAAIVVVIFVIFLLAIVLWTGVFPGPHLTSNPRVQP
jgi:hypothetical protein